MGMNHETRACYPFIFFLSASDSVSLVSHLGVHGCILHVSLYIRSFIHYRDWHAWGCVDEFMNMTRTSLDPGFDHLDSNPCSKFSLAPRQVGMSCKDMTQPECRCVSYF